MTFDFNIIHLLHGVLTSASTTCMDFWFQHHPSLAWTVHLIMHLLHRVLNSLPPAHLMDSWLHSYSLIAGTFDSFIQSTHRVLTSQLKAFIRRSCSWLIKFLSYLVGYWLKDRWRDIVLSNGATLLRFRISKYTLATTYSAIAFFFFLTIKKRNIHLEMKLQLFSRRVSFQVRKIAPHIWNTFALIHQYHYILIKL